MLSVVEKHAINNTSKCTRRFCVIYDMIRVFCICVCVLSLY